MPGSNLNLVLPSGSDTMAAAIAKIATALSAIQDDLAPKLTPAEFNINAALDMQGNALTDCTSVQFTSGNIPGVAGSLYYYNGEFYCQDATGVIQLTSNGLLDAAGLGGIVGDYGGVNPARVSYDDASGEYRFTEDTGIWADLVCDDLVLEGTAGSVRLGVDPAITTARLITVKSLPASGVSLLVYNASTSTLEDGAVTAVTNIPTLPGVNLTADSKHTDTYWTELPLGLGTRLTSCGYTGISGTSTGLDGAAAWLNSTSTSWEYTSSSHGSWGLRRGDRIKSVRIVGVYSGVVNFNLYKLKDDGTCTLVWSIAPIPASGTTSNLGSPVAIGAGERWFIDLSGAASGTTIKLIEIGYDHP